MHESLREHVGGELVERRSEAEQLGPFEAVERLDALDLRHPERQRPGLVEQNSSSPAELLDHAGALDDDAAARRARDACDERDRRGEDQRARRRDDHHREEPNRVAAHRPGDACRREGDREEQRGIAVGDPDERCALRLCLPHESNDPGVGAVGRASRRAQVEGVAGVGGTAPYFVTRERSDRHRFPGQRRLVDDGFAVRDHAVDGDDLACANDDDVAGVDLVDVDLLDRAAAAPVRDARRAFE